MLNIVEMITEGVINPMAKINGFFNLYKEKFFLFSNQSMRLKRIKKRARERKTIAFSLSNMTLVCKLINIGMMAIAKSHISSIIFPENTFNFDFIGYIDFIAFIPLMKIEYIHVFVLISLFLLFSFFL